MATTATLIVEIGSVTTRVSLVDTVADTSRLIGQAEVSSTYEPPYDDVVVGVLQAVASISELTGRQLLENGNLLMPHTTENDGTDRLIAVTSAAGPMSIVIAAVSGDISARSALHASRAVNSTVLQTITLNESTDHMVATGDYSWIERQVQRLLGLNPDAIIIAGGLEDGAQDTLVRLAHIIGLTALSSRVDADGQARQDVTVRPVVYAGNSHAAERVIESLSNRAETIVVENVRPSLERSNLDPTRRALTKLYNDRVLGRMPGLQALRRMAGTPLRTTIDAAELMTRFLAAYYQRNVLTLDIGSASTSILLHSQGSSSMAVLGAIGSGYGVGNLLFERGTAALMRWLPYPTSERDLTHALLNRQIRPQMIPTSREEVLLDHAVAREALALAGAALFDERPKAAFDFVVASGGVLAHAPHPGYALLTVLDALQPLADERAIDIYLDTLGLISAAGALAFVDAEGALSLIEHDLLRNMPLATVIVAVGNGRGGDVAVEAELKPVEGDVQVVRVVHGQLARLELPPGMKGQLTLKAADNVRIGRNAPGEQVVTGAAEVTGSALGVVIDARGRPLRLPTASLERQQMLWDWLVTLGAESGPLPYATGGPLPAMLDAAPEPLVLLVEELAPAQASLPTATAGQPGIDGDLGKLRQSVESPKKRGMFGRK